VESITLRSKDETTSSGASTRVAMASTVRAAGDSCCCRNQARCASPQTAWADGLRCWKGVIVSAYIRTSLKVVFALRKEISVLAGEPLLTAGHPSKPVHDSSSRQAINIHVNLLTSVLT
jgi:hypothetical protein